MTNQTDSAINDVTVDNLRKRLQAAEKLLDKWAVYVNTKVVSIPSEEADGSPDVVVQVRWAHNGKVVTHYFTNDWLQRYSGDMSIMASEMVDAFYTDVLKATLVKELAEQLPSAVQNCEKVNAKAKQ